VTRDEVAGGVGVSRKLAAFHLERLVDAGLLAVAPSGRSPARSGLRAGRPAKRYVTSDAEIAIEIPPRSYALAGRLLAQAIERGGSSSSATAIRLAADEGRRLGGERGGAVHLTDVLGDLGFEPVVGDSDSVVLANCPFHALAEAAPDLVCQMNEALVQGIVEGLGDTHVRAELEPGEGRCCVVLSSTSAAQPTRRS
jgi:predicted ArsR family transcriptional regulator